MDPLREIGEILKEYSLHTGVDVKRSPLMLRIEEKLQLSEELVFILPAFPAKSPSKEKTSGDLPDFGEVLALQNLQSFCERLGQFHTPGARIVICSDGRVFSDVVDVGDLEIDRYNDGIKEIISQFGLSCLSVFSMDDLYPEMTPEGLRTLLLDVYAMEPEEVRELVSENENQRALFNGIHRFLFEDELSRETSVSRSMVQKKTKIKAYELLRRSDAWSNLLNDHFRHALRLSIHPHPIGSEKFGIKLVASSSNWATPWHNVVVKIKGSFELMHLKKARELNAVLRMEMEKYAYFEVANV